MLASAVYISGAIVSLVCAILLLRQYSRTRVPLLLWSGLCFAGLTLSNGLVFVDLVVFPVEINLYTPRLAVTAVSMTLLLYGLIWESK